MAIGPTGQPDELGQDDLVPELVLGPPDDDDRAGRWDLRPQFPGAGQFAGVGHEASSLAGAERLSGQAQAGHPHSSRRPQVPEKATRQEQLPLAIAEVHPPGQLFLADGDGKLDCAALALLAYPEQPPRLADRWPSADL